jgi:hypothetical protein
VIIWDNDGMTDLSWLPSLKNVEGSVLLGKNPALTNINALNTLETVTGSLQIWNNPALTTLPAFHSLTTVRQVQVKENPVLTALASFDAVTSVMEDVEIGNNGPDNTMTTLSGFSSVPSITVGSVDIHQNATSIKVFGAVQDVAGMIIINSICSQFNSFGALHVVGREFSFNGRGLQSASGSFANLLSVTKSFHVRCVDCSAIPSFDSLSTVKNNGDWSGLPGFYVTLDSDTGQLNGTLPPFASLTEVDGGVNIHASNLAASSQQLMPNLEAVLMGSLSIKLDGAVTEASGFNKLQKVEGGISIISGSLTHLEGFEALTTTNGLSLEAPLVSVPNFNALVDYGKKGDLPEVSLTYWGSLPDFGPALEAYPTMASLKRAGSLRLWNNDVMTSFDGLTGLEQIQTLVFDNCDALTSITGLSNLKQVGGLYDDDPFNNPANHGSLMVNSGSLANISGLANLETVENNLSLLGSVGDPTVMAALTSVGGDLYVSANEDHYCQALDWFDGISKGGGAVNGTPPEGGCE